MFRGIGCFFTGHDERSGEQLIYENDWCAKCFVEWPQDKITLPRLLMYCFGWLIEREWQWFDRFDDWICANHRNRLPDWWEY